MKRVLISGGSRGIGAECVRHFAAAGCRVAFIYKNSKEQAERVSHDTGALAIRADISEPSEVRAALREALTFLGGVDLLVNNAGISHIGLFTELSDDEWMRLCGTNLSGTIYLTREVARHMVLAHEGRIVNIGSVWGRAGASCEVAYSALKSALRGFTRALAKELGPSGITVNCIEPGVIDTDMNSGLSDDIRAQLIDETPLQRVGTPGDVAEAVMFFASDAAGFITGQILGVDGGFGL